jgi:CubicO group peptidase (beta-lactamase class C family)
MRFVYSAVLVVFCLSFSAAQSCRAEVSPFAAIDQALAGDAAPRTTSVVVTRGGKVVYEKYLGVAGRDHLNDTRSATKSVTALLVGIAIGDGLLQLDTRVFDVLKKQRPWAHDASAKMEITVEDLLTMSSALDCNDNEDKSPGNEENMYPKREWLRWAVDLPVKPQYVRDARGRGPWAYCTAGSLLLGQILQHVTREGVEKYAERRLFQPLGITALEWHRSPSGETMTGGGLRLRALDLAKLGRLVLQEGSWEEKQIVPREYLARAIVKHHATPIGLDYGYQFWRRDYKTTCGVSSAPFMAGNGGNHVVLLKQLDAVIVVTRVHYSSRGMHQQTMKLVEETILPALPCA